MERQAKSLERLELKYCERCGGLWLRRKGSVRLYCSNCAPKMANLPEPKVKTGGRAIKPKPELEARGLELFGLAEGGQP